MQEPIRLDIEPNVSHGHWKSTSLLRLTRPGDVRSSLHRVSYVDETGVARRAKDEPILPGPFAYVTPTPSGEWGSARHVHDGDLLILGDHTFRLVIDSDVNLELFDGPQPPTRNHEPPTDQKVDTGMTQETPLTIVGNLAADPRLAHTKGGDPVVNFRVGSTASKRNSDTGEWHDAETIWMDCVAFRAKAEAIAAALKKGSRVILSGHMKASVWLGPDGSKRTKLELEVFEVGLTLQAPSAAEREVSHEVSDPWGSADDRQPVGVGGRQ